MPTHFLPRGLSPNSLQMRSSRLRRAIAISRDRGIHCVIVIPTTAGIHGALSLFLHRSGKRHARTGVASGAAAHYRVAVDEGILYSSRHDHDT